MRDVLRSGWVRALTVGLAMAGGAGLAVLAGAAPPRAIETVDVRELRVVDGRGKPRIVLTTKALGGSPSITIYDDDGDARVTVESLGRRSPLLNVGGLGEKDAAVNIGLTLDGAPTVNARDREGRLLFDLP